MQATTGSVFTYLQLQNGYCLWRPALAHTQSIFLISATSYGAEIAFPQKPRTSATQPSQNRSLDLLCGPAQYAHGPRRGAKRSGRGWPASAIAGTGTAPLRNGRPPAPPVPHRSSRRCNSRDRGSLRPRHARRGRRNPQTATSDRCVQ